MWRELSRAGGPADVAPGVLRDLGLYGGAQGIWTDTKRTGKLSEDGAGVTVGLLHTGRHYADDLGAESILYHYPKTGRRGKDSAEIAATKNAAAMKLPVFVITPGSKSDMRTVIRGDVVGWDDGLEVFRVQFLGGPAAAGAEPSRGVPAGPRRVRAGPAGDVKRLGSEYRAADEASATAPRDPFTIDPDKIDRGLRGHARTQNLLRAWLAARGVVAVSPPRDPFVPPNYDIAWSIGEADYVGEVKSITAANQAQQIRFGLGQVLDYAFVLSSRRGRAVRPVLVLEREPSDGRWSELCDRHGVVLVWPETFDRIPARA
jgi:hypothetical protein